MKSNRKDDAVGNRSRLGLLFLALLSCVLMVQKCSGFQSVMIAKKIASRQHSTSSSSTTTKTTTLAAAAGESTLFFGDFVTDNESDGEQTTTTTPTTMEERAKDAERRLLDAIEEGGDRLSNSDTVTEIIGELENGYRDVSIPEPAVAAEVYGRWRLVYTSNAGTSSPIQRRAVDSKSFPIYQDIVVNDIGQLVVSQVVVFSDKIALSVDALASTSSYPLEELSERQTTGKVLGWNVLGVSLVGEEAKPDPTRPNSRIDFVFDEGNFDFDGAFNLPYPVPFRLPILRDWVKGWIDITYLSDRVRISRGNKGTTFVLVKED